MYYIGIDVGGTNLKAGLVDENYRIVDTKKIPLEFESMEQVLGKVKEGLKELEEGIRDQNALENPQKERLDEEFGDLMFSMINLSRFLGLNAENSLTNATNKFINRCVGIELLARE